MLDLTPQWSSTFTRNILKVGDRMEKLFNPEFSVERAKVVTPELVAKIITRKRVTLVTGGKLLEDELLADLVSEIAKKAERVIATGASSKPLIERGIKCNVMTLHHLTQKIEKGTYVFVGFEPYLLSSALSTLRHFSKAVTISIDRYYQPNARLSFPNCDNYGMLETLISFMR